jgi:hypothetical protein
VKDKEDKKKQQQLAEQSAADRALFMSSFQEAKKPSPLQEAWERAQMDFLNWEQGKGTFEGKPIDVMDAPGMGPSLSLYRRAKAGQEGERAGIGALRMGLNASSPELAAKLAQQSKDRREQEAAGALEEALAMRTAEAHGSVLPLAQLNTSRNLSLAGMAGGQAQGSQGLWANFRTRPSWLADMANNAARGAGQAIAFA